MSNFWHTRDVLEEVAAERERQIRKWGRQDHLESGSGGSHNRTRANIAKAEYDDMVAYGELQWIHILTEEFWEALAEPEGPELRQELIQVAAVAIAWVEAIDRRDA